MLTRQQQLELFALARVLRLFEQHKQKNQPPAGDRGDGKARPKSALSNKAPKNGKRK
jgi:hypothetical protein